MASELAETESDAFRILRIRLLRPPPTWFELAKSVKLELAVGIQDDYGVHVDTFDTLECTPIS